MNLVLPTVVTWAAVIWAPQGTCLPSLDLPATSQPVQKNPQAGEPPGVEGWGRRGLTLLWNS